jgi:hypothetical protein
MRLMSPQWVAVAATLVVVGGSATAGYLHFRGDEKAPITSDAPAKATADDAQAVAAALLKLAKRPQTLVAADVQSAVGANARKAVPSGATVTPNEATWHPDGLGGGTMTVTIGSNGQPPVTYTAIMLKERTGWKVLGTVPMAPAPAAPAAAAPPAVPAAPAGTTQGTTTGTTTGQAPR